MKTISRTSRAALLLTLVATILVALAAPADAGTYSTSGRVGSHSVAPVSCRHKIFGQSQTLEIKAPPPVVYAANLRAGGGNDAQYVRYGIVVRDYRTGATVTTANWSGWLYATDNKASTWTGVSTFNLSALNNRIYRLDYVIQWHNGTSLVGEAAYEANNVHYYSYTNVKYTGMGACWRYA